MGVARGNGRLGWHIECFAMTRRYLSELFAIHGGGADLLFPHHEAEYGSAGLPARYWIRTALVRQDGRKMSKSLGNMTFVSYLLLTYSGTAIRLGFAQAHEYEESTGCNRGNNRGIREGVFDNEDRAEYYRSQCRLNHLG